MYRGFSLAAAVMISLQAQAQSDLLGSAQGFAVLGGSTVTNTGPTSVTGDLGVWPGSAIVGFPGGVTGTVHTTDTAAQQAQTDLTIAYNSLAGMALTQTLTDVDLSGLTLGPGVYRFASSAAISSTPLTLDAQGNPNAQFVFQIGTTLLVANNASVVLINGANACNLYWQVGTSATLGTGASLKGTILAQASISLATGASISQGRALARNGGVTMDSNSVTLAGCAAVKRKAHTSAEMGGRITMTYIDPTGHPVMLQRSPSGAWTQESLDQTASPVPISTNQYATHTYVDARDGKSYVCITSPTGLFVVDSAASPLGVRNLTTETLAASPDASAITGPSTVFQSEPDGHANIIGVNAAGQIVRYFETGAVSGGNSVWSFMNISTTQLTPNGIATPQFASNLVSYVSPWGGLDVAGLDASGDVWAVWWAPGTPHWWANNISEASDAPPFLVEVGLTAFDTPWGGLNLAGLDQQGNVIVQWWAPASGAGNWTATNLTESFGGTPLESVGLTSFVLPWGALNVVGVTPGGDLVMYWWIPGFDHWVITSVRDATAEASPERLMDGLTGVGGPNGVISILGESAGGDTVRYMWQPGNAGTWHSENVTGSATLRH